MQWAGSTSERDAAVWLQLQTRHVAPDGSWKWTFLCDGDLNDGRKVEAPIVIPGGLDQPHFRPALVDALIKRLSARETPDAALAQLAQDLSGRKIPALSRPPQTKAPGKPTARSGPCVCNRRLPWVNAYHRGRIVQVLAFHGLPRREGQLAKLCAPIIGIYAVLDPYLPWEDGTLPPDRTSARLDREAWWTQLAAAVPNRFGGPLGEMPGLGGNAASAGPTAPGALP